MCSTRSENDRYCRYKVSHCNRDIYFKTLLWGEISQQHLKYLKCNFVLSSLITQNIYLGLLSHIWIFAPKIYITIFSIEKNKVEFSQRNRNFEAFYSKKIVKNRQNRKDVSSTPSSHFSNFSQFSGKTPVDPCTTIFITTLQYFWAWRHKAPKQSKLFG